MSLLSPSALILLSAIMNSLDPGKNSVERSDPALVMDEERGWLS